MKTIRTVLWSIAAILFFFSGIVQYLNINLSNQTAIMLFEPYTLPQRAETSTIEVQNHTLPSKAELELLATNLYREAAGEGIKGMVAVMYVVQERVKRPYWPSTYKAVVTQRNQFEWLRKYSKADKPILKNSIDRKAWDNAVMVAYAFLTTEEPIKLPEIEGATHYYKIGSKVPAWAKSKNMVYLGTIGKHKFYKELKRV